MGRKRNFSTEVLILLIDEYFSDVRSNSINTGRITSEGIAKYLRETGREPDIMGYHIRRDSEANNYIESKSNELNSLLSTSIPSVDTLPLRTFRADLFYATHKNDTYCGLNIIGDYFNNYLSLITEQNKVISGLQKQVIQMKSKIKEQEKIISGKDSLSAKHYTDVIEHKKKYNKLEEKYNELVAIRAADEKTLQMAILSDMHIVPINRKPNTYAKHHSYLGEPDRKTPGLTEILNRFSDIEAREEQEPNEPYWKDLVEDNNDEQI